MRIRGYLNKDPNYELLPSGGNLLSGLKKINIFVGANNSGKSRFLRQLFKGTPDDFVFFENVNKELGEIFNELEPKFRQLFYMKDLKALADSGTGDYVHRFNDFFEKIINKASRSNGQGNIWDLDVALAIRNQMMHRGIHNKREGGFNQNILHVYIPILRGLRHPVQVVSDQAEKSDVFSSRTISDYKLDNVLNEKNAVFSGLTMYGELKRMLLGSKEGRQFVRDFEGFISSSFFEGKDITLIPDLDTDNVKMNIDDGEADRATFDLGDGIQSILISTFKIYQHQKESLVLFIEEPELMMHPAMQRILVETFINKFPNLQVFLTTHSNHFLDLTYDYPDDVAIFSFRESEREKFIIENVTDNTKILDLLGVRNSSVFLSNCVIWAEGVTDRMILRKILELDHSFDYKEDFHYAFAEYGGSNLKNFNFVQSDNKEKVSISAISKKNYVIADNDAEKSGKRFERRQNIKMVLGEDQVFDEHIEIENLIPYSVWILAIEKLLKDHPEKEIRLKRPLKDAESKFNALLETKKIGTLLRKFVVEMKEDKLPKYFGSDDVQCLGSPKKQIAEYILVAIDELELTLADFPPIAKSLIGSLGKFVAEVNDKK